MIAAIVNKRPEVVHLEMKKIIKEEDDLRIENEFREKTKAIEDLLIGIFHLNPRDIVTQYGFKILIPAASLFLSYEYGCLRNYYMGDRIMFVTAIRGMIETMGFISYFELNDPSDKVFEKFSQKGRIYNNDKISISKQIEAISKITSSTGAKELYDDLCRKMHFGKDHLAPTIIKVEKNNSSQSFFHMFVGKYMDQDLSDLGGVIDDLNKTMEEILEHYKNEKIKKDENCNRLRYNIKESILYNDN